MRSELQSKTEDDWPGKRFIDAAVLDHGLSRIALDIPVLFLTRHWKFRALTFKRSICRSLT